LGRREASTGLSDIDLEAFRLPFGNFWFSAGSMSSSFSEEEECAGDDGSSTSVGDPTWSSGSSSVDGISIWFVLGLGRDLVGPGRTSLVTRLVRGIVS